MRIREPIVAGRFYPDDAARCKAALAGLLDAVSPCTDIGDRPIGGLVPHAGWTYSGAVTAKVFAALAARTLPSCGLAVPPSNSPLANAGSPPAPAGSPVVILFGGVHRFRGREAALFGSGRWETPLGPAVIDERLAERILGHTNLIVDDPYAHEDEHSIEVQVPFVRHLFPEAKIVPLMVPPVKMAAEVGEAVARTLKAYRYDAIIVGTTDLTHYGPRYGFIPKGIGPQGRQWAKDVNDRRFIDLVCAMKTQDLVAEAAQEKNACSGGAAAATLAACAALGATQGHLLEHTSSSEVAFRINREQAEDSVGYAGILFS